MKKDLYGFPIEENIEGYIVNPHPLAIDSCPGCGYRLLPARNVNIYTLEVHSTVISVEQISLK